MNVRVSITSYGPRVASSGCVFQGADNVDSLDICIGLFSTAEKARIVFLD